MAEPGTGPGSAAAESAPQPLLAWPQASVSSAVTWAQTTCLGASEDHRPSAAHEMPVNQPKALGFSSQQTSSPGYLFFTKKDPVRAAGGGVPLSPPTAA